MAQKYPPSLYKVTIIVAAYNVDKWLEDCLDSIRNQTYQNWECLIINDGSMDNTAEIAKKFCNEDNRFFLITKENGGLSSVRNAGLERSTGDYVYFVDGDDMLTNECLQICLNNIENVDVVSAGCYVITENGTKINKENAISSMVLYQTDAINYYLDRKFLTSVWSKFYSRKIIGNQRFVEQMRAAEDLQFNTKLILTNPDIKIRVINDPIYQYRIINTSLSHGRSKRRLKLLDVQVSQMDAVYESNKDTIHKICLDAFANNMLTDLVWHMEIQGLFIKVDANLKPLMQKYVSLYNGNSDAYYKAKFITEHPAWMTNIVMTFKYLPFHIKRIVKTIIRK